MYHYVRNQEGSPYKLHARSAEEFEEQLNRLVARYKIIGIEEYLGYLEGRYTLGEEACLLSFDDGLKDHYETVYPLLRKRGLSGVFLLITGSLAESRVASVHKIHFLLARLGMASFRERFLGELIRRSPDFVWGGEQASLQETGYRYDDLETARFKRLLNFELDETLRDGILAEMFEDVFGNETAFSRNLYLSWDEIQEMKDNGMSFGGHTHTHTVLSRLAPKEARQEIRRCHDVLVGGLGSNRFSFAYPYGREDTFTDSVVQLLAETGFSCALTTIRGHNVGRRCDRYRLKRLDTNDLMGPS